METCCSSQRKYVWTMGSQTGQPSLQRCLPLPAQAALLGHLLCMLTSAIGLSAGTLPCRPWSTCYATSGHNVEPRTWKKGAHPSRPSGADRQDCNLGGFQFLGSGSYISLQLRRCSDHPQRVRKLRRPSRSSLAVSRGEYDQQRRRNGSRFVGMSTRVQVLEL
jgi:hypothetical protein